VLALILKIQKAIFAAVRPKCWKAFAFGVVPASEHAIALRGLTCDRILDVGANRGQFSMIARILHADVPIEAFEPQPSEAAMYRQLLGDDPLITLHEVALGDQAGEADLHISRRRDSSSLLPIGDLQAKLFPSTEEVGTHRVKVVRLDDYAFRWQSSQRMLLKLDVQGFELDVLRGSTDFLKQCAFVYAECSEMALYTGQALFPEVRSFLVEHGFRHVRSLNEQYADGQMIQADHLFARI
jgi:FkbM family methyltransferase